MPSIASGQDVSIAWSEMEKFFAPPEQYKGKFGDYRSVMKFDDGTPVKTAQDWTRRRLEILKDWHGVMGSWPALVEKPRIVHAQPWRRVADRLHEFSRREKAVIS